MSEESKAIVRKTYEAIGPGDYGVFDQYFTSGLVYHGVGGMEMQGLDVLKELSRMYGRAFPDAKAEIHDQAAEGDKVWTRLTHTGTHKGELHGIAPTGNRMSIAGMSVHRLVEGNIVEMWDVTDQIAMMRQLGVIAGPEPGA